MRHRPARGFTLIELLVVVAIIGIISAIAVSNLHQAVQRARQRRSMADMRSWANGISAYIADFSLAPIHSGSLSGVRDYVVPTYLRTMPVLDGWGNEYLYKADGLEYTIQSTGSDGLEQASLPLGTTHRFADDIVVANGLFVQWPDGTQLE